jgi:protein phosphatase
MIPEAQVGELLASTRSLPDAGRALIEAANAAGGRDNITVILFRLEEVGAVGGGTSAEDTTEHDAVTVAGATAPASEAATAAGATGAATTAGPTAAVAARERTAEPAEPIARRREPRAPRTEGTNGQRRRRRRVRVPTGLLVSFFILVAIALSAWYASQTVYFVGSNQGFVTVYRGLPYDLPAGLDLYSVNYVSGVPVSELPPARRRLVTEHKLRSRDDAQDLVRQMETGALRGS